MIGAFGNVIFSVSENKIKTFRDMKRETSARYSDHEVIGAKAKREFLGPDLDSMSFTMELSVFRGVSPISMEETMRKYCEKGQEQSLVLGGKLFGEFCVESVSAAYEVVDSGGGILGAKLDVSLKEYN